MKPIKAMELSSKVAQKSNNDERMVSDVLDFFWKNVRSSVSKLEHPTIHLDNLGSFKVRPWVLPKIEEKYQGIHDALSNSEDLTFRKRVILQETNERLKVIDNIKSILDSEKQRAEKIKKSR